MDIRVLNILTVLLFEWFAVRASFFSFFHLNYILLVAISIVYLSQKSSRNGKRRSKPPNRLKENETNMEDAKKEKRTTLILSPNQTACIRTLTKKEIEEIVLSFKEDLNKSESKLQGISQEDTETAVKSKVKAKYQKDKLQVQERFPQTERQFSDSISDILRNAENVKPKLQDIDLQSTTFSSEKENIKKYRKFSKKVQEEFNSKNIPEPSENQLTAIKKFIVTVKNNLSKIEKIWSKYQAKYSESSTLKMQPEDMKIEAKISEIKHVVNSVETNLKKIDNIRLKFEEINSQDSSMSKQTERIKLKEKLSTPKDFIKSSDKQETRTKSQDIFLENRTSTICNEGKKENKKSSTQTHKEATENRSFGPLEKLKDEKIQQLVHIFENHSNSEKKVSPNEILHSITNTDQKEDFKKNDESLCLDNAECPTHKNKSPLKNFTLIEMKHVVNTMKNNFGTVEKMWDEYQKHYLKNTATSIPTESSEVEQKISEIKQVLRTSDYIFNEIEKIQSLHQEGILQMMSSVTTRKNDTVNNRPSPIENLNEQAIQENSNFLGIFQKNQV